MMMVSLIPGCLLSRRPPSSRWVLSLSSCRVFLSWWNCSVSSWVGV